MNEEKRSEYIQLINEAIGKETLTGFASRADISPGNLSRIRKGQPASMETLRKIADASYTVAFRELADAAGFDLSQEIVSPASPDQSRMTRIPCIKGVNGKSQLKTNSSPRWEPYDLAVVGEGDLVFFEVVDNAFTKLSPGDRVLVDMAKKPADGDMVLFLYDGKETLLRRLSMTGNQYLFYGDDLAEYPPLTAKKSAVTIYGVVSRAIIQL